MRQRGLSNERGDSKRTPNTSGEFLSKLGVTMPTELPEVRLGPDVGGGVSSEWVVEI